jgi:methylphosphotriester-DNA--protein-cysteine methyltransferase
MRYLIHVPRRRYCDQAHLGHEFRAFSGMTPSGYAASHRPHVDHVAID